MRKLMGVLLLLGCVGIARAQDKPVVPTQGPAYGPNPGQFLYTVQVRGITGVGTLLIGDAKSTTDDWKLQVRYAVESIGTYSGNQDVVNAASLLTFPELGDVKGDAACYCGSTLNKDPLDDQDDTYMLSGKSKCVDAFICYIKGVSGGQDNKKELPRLLPNNRWILPKPTLPLDGFEIGENGAFYVTVTVKGIENGVSQFIIFRKYSTDIVYWKYLVRSTVADIGALAGNPIVTEAAPFLTFPELSSAGYPELDYKESPGQCYCNVKSPGKGGCSYGFICYIKGVSKAE
jgi:hypothetical protein